MLVSDVIKRLELVKETFGDLEVNFCIETENFSASKNKFNSIDLNSKYTEDDEDPWLIKE